jgi:hypothetical protein
MRGDVDISAILEIEVGPTTCPRAPFQKQVKGIVAACRSRKLEDRGRFYRTLSIWWPRDENASVAAPFLRAL